ncbi:DUF5666 domain-containing protein [Idiomarina sp. UBA3162]|uniref:DUF5666 domain-containing protein n=1 Tax=Idiomarina sp. UBA3162 TaxID=1946641 RepID=UPI000C9849E6|nr:DUF5666 domain-containing protein [Idiomarina sp. UBA3162]MAD54772.1 hypothetical protein [Idiomarinaceae bacterium]|tara:strand:- start:2920 stop:4638 length:1719 start_codon:yes stop_codon:yes gene_type:complete
MFKRSLLVIALSSALAACGGSDSSTDSSTGDNGGGNETASSTIVTEGVITGFGSVYVNGERYRSDNATIALDNAQSGTESDLKVGMVVKMKATRSGNETPEASEIEYEEEIQGRVDFIDIDNQAFTVLGQTINFDDVTEFVGVTDSTLAVGDFVEISGYLNEDGEFYATLVELESDEDELKVKGNIAGLDTDAQTFMLGELTIDYSQASFEEMTADDLQDGLAIKVEGSQYDSTSDTLIADSIEQKDSRLDDDVDELEVAGVVGNYDAAAGTFVIKGYQVALDDDTEFDEGEEADLSNGVRIKVEARNDGESWVAEEIEFQEYRAVGRTEGAVSEIDADNGLITVNGIEFLTTSQTRYKDDSDADLRQFTFDDIAVNDVLRVIAREDQQGQAIALKIKRLDEEDRDGEVKGVPSDISETGFTLAGVEVIVNDETRFKTDDSRISLDEFIALFDGDTELRVEVEGEWDGDQLIAHKVEVDLDDDDDADDGDDDGDDRQGYTEYEGEVTDVNGEAFTVNGIEARLTTDSELKINDEEVTLQAFVDALAEGVVVEVEGQWQEESYVLVYEAEIDD